MESGVNDNQILIPYRCLHSYSTVSGAHQLTLRQSTIVLWCDAFAVHPLLLLIDMVEEGSCPQRVIGSLLEGSVLSTILLLTAFSIGVFSSSFLRAVFGILFKLNHRKSSTVKTLSSPEELPKLPDTVRT